LYYEKIPGVLPFAIFAKGLPAVAGLPAMAGGRFSPITFVLHRSSVFHPMHGTERSHGWNTIVCA
jgi:hypothetical protein